MEDLCFGYTSSDNGAECTISMTLGEEEAVAWLDFLRGGRLEIRDGAYRITAERVSYPETVQGSPIVGYHDTDGNLVTPMEYDY